MNDSDNIKYTLGITVKELRNKRKITQEQLAEYLGLQPHSVTKIETGRTFVSSEVLAKLSDFFGVSPSYFFNKKFHIISEDGLNHINEIRKILPTLSNERLKDIYNIILALQNV